MKEKEGKKILERKGKQTKRMTQTRRQGYQRRRRKATVLGGRQYQASTLPYDSEGTT